MTTDPDDWDRHWAAYGDTASTNPAVRYRRRLILDRIGDPRAGDTLLDIGCGQGELSLALQQRFPDARVIGMDYSAEGVQRAARAAQAAKVPVRFLQRDLLEPEEVDPELRGQATFAVCTEVLEHLDHPAQFLRNASAYLAAGCRVVVTVPGGPRSAFDRHIGHRQHFRPQGLRHLLEVCGFEVDSVVRAGFPFFDLYRLAIIARGAKVISDVEQSPSGTENRAARVALTFFDRAFRWNLDKSPFGSQLVAVARFTGSNLGPAPLVEQ